MATILIDKLLQACVKQGASDIHITVGQPPVFRLHGRMRKLETKVLEPDDTVALMKSITPERCQRELQEQGSADFGFAFGDQARFRVSVFKERGNFGMVLRQIPNKLLTMEQIGIPRSAAAGLSEPCVEFSPTDRANILRIVPSAAFAGSVAPITSRYLAIAPSPSRTCNTIGPDVMKSTSSP